MLMNWFTLPSKFKVAFSVTQNKWRIGRPQYIATEAARD